MRVHYETLVKVKLFRNCEPGMISDLVVLLAPMFYLSGDLVCMKNDIGKEMYIIKSGSVQVLRAMCSPKKCIFSIAVPGGGKVLA